jgi:hypothetical protein
MFHTNVHKTKTYFIFKNFFSEKRNVYAIMWKGMVEQERPQVITQIMVTILHMCFAGWITKVTCTYTHTKTQNM